MVPPMGISHVQQVHKPRPLCKLWCTAAKLSQQACRRAFPGATPSCHSASKGAWRQCMTVLRHARHTMQVLPLTMPNTQHSL